MKKLLILIFMLGIISFGESVSQTVARIRKDYNETNNYKGYRIKTEYDENIGDGGIEIKKYYRNDSLRKVVIEGSTDFFPGIGYRPGGKTIEYYLKNGKTYFKFVTFRSGNLVRELRFYYNNNKVLVRYIDENGVVHDNENGLYDIFLSEPY